MKRLLLAIVTVALCSGCAHRRPEAFNYQLRHAHVYEVDGITVVECHIIPGSARFDAKTGKIIYECRK